MRYGAWRQPRRMREGKTQSHSATQRHTLPAFVPTQQQVVVQSSVQAGQRACLAPAMRPANPQMQARAMPQAALLRHAEGRTAVAAAVTTGRQAMGSEDAGHVITACAFARLAPQPWRVLWRNGHLGMRHNRGCLAVPDNNSSSHCPLHKSYPSAGATWQTMQTVQPVKHVVLTMLYAQATCWCWLP
jgi:hypothetical protein